MIFISIVSHNHFELIRSIGALLKFKDSKQLTVILRDNVGEPGFETWCESLGFYYFRNQKSFGFGENNNLNFSVAENLGMSSNDYFLTVNPDIDCAEENIIKVKNNMLQNNVGLATLNLFLDNTFTEFDPCVRKFPKMKDFTSSFLFGINNSIIDKNRLDSLSYVDWFAGSFMMFRASHYKRLNGFDEKYFMYCEDLDICWRYHQEFGSKVVLFKDIYAVHYARKNSQKIFSIHFLWHFKSCIRYLLR